MKNHTAIKRKSKLYIISIVTICTAALLLKFPTESAEGVKEGLQLCTTAVIPSLFPFMTVSAFAVQSGISARLGRIIEPVCRFLFGLPGSCGTVIIMGLIGGFPVGARMAAALYKQGDITKTQFDRLLCFCVNAGPAFIIGTVGVVLIGSMKAGIILYAAQAAASLIIGICTRFFIHETDEKITASSKINRTSIADSFVLSVSDSSKGILSACAYIVLFSAILNILNACGIIPAIVDFITPPLLKLGVPYASINALLPAILEVTEGCVLAGKSGLILICLALGWGGFSVHFQIYACTSGIDLKKSRFILCRAIQAILSTAIFILLLKFIPLDIAVSASTGNTDAALFSVSPVASIALLIFCMVFLISLPNKTIFKKVNRTQQ